MPRGKGLKAKPANQPDETQREPAPDAATPVKAAPAEPVTPSALAAFMAARDKENAVRACALAARCALACLRLTGARVARQSAALSAALAPVLKVFQRKAKPAAPVRAPQCNATARALFSCALALCCAAPRRLAAVLPASTRLTHAPLRLRLPPVPGACRAAHGGARSCGPWCGVGDAI